MAVLSKVNQSTAFTSATTGAGVILEGYFDMTIQGGVGTIKIEKSYDGGTVWYDVSQDASGSIASYIVAAGTEISTVGFEPLKNVVYRFNVTAYTSGTITAIFVN